MTNTPDKSEMKAWRDLAVRAIDCLHAVHEAYEAVVKAFQALRPTSSQAPSDDVVERELDEDDEALVQQAWRRYQQVASSHDALVEHMVRRFLSWKLPADFNPDGGISAQRPNYAPNVKWEPSGTNLLDYTQAEAMVRHMLDGAAIPPAGGRLWCEDKVFDDCEDGNEPTEYVRADLSRPPADQVPDMVAIQKIAQVLWEKVGPAITAARAANIARDILAALQAVPAASEVGELREALEHVRNGLRAYLPCSAVMSPVSHEKLIQIIDAALKASKGTGE